MIFQFHALQVKRPTVGNWIILQI